MKRRAKRPVIPRYTYTPPDAGYIFLLMVMTGLGLLMTWSTSIWFSDPEELLKKLGFILGVGLTLLLACLLLPPNFWRRAAPLAAILSVAALVSLKIPRNPLAVEVNGATSWLAVGPITVQPSEYAKLAAVLVTAWYIERKGTRWGLLDWIGYMAWFGVLTAAIAVQPDLGTAVVLVGLVVATLFASGIDWKVLAAGILLGIIAFSYAVQEFDHARERIEVWRNPWAYSRDAGYQNVQAQIAIARGGLFGVGFGSSLYKLDDRLPEAESDFVFAIMAEELGLVGTLAIIAVMCLFFWRGYVIASRAKDLFQRVIAIGVTSWMAVQSIVNIGVVLGVLPNTGVPLPFFSAGGSSFTALLAGAGLVIGVSMRERVNPEGEQTHARTGTRTPRSVRTMRGRTAE